MSDTDLSHAFHLLAKDMKADSQYWFPELHEGDQMKLITHYALGLAGETGELVNLIKKMNRGSLIEAEDVSNEIADVFIYLVDLAHSLGINVWDAFVSKHHDLEERWGKRP